MKFSTEPQDESAPANDAPRSSVLPPGIYPFSVLDAKEEVSKAGNDMLHLKIGAERPNGTAQWVHDYIVNTQTGKLKAFCAAVGMLDDFGRGEISATEFIGATGKVKLRIEPAKGSYPEKNAVAEYVERKQPDAPSDDAPSEEIPF